MMLALWIVGPSGVLLAQAGKYEGRKVVEIRYSPAIQPLSDATLERILPVKTGDTLRLAGITDAIRSLYETGRYSDIAVDASLRGEDVVLEFQTKGAWFVGRVGVDSVPEPPNQGQLVNS